MPKPVCVKCQCFYRPEKNGFAFIEAMPRDPYAERGTRAPESWEPYKLWNGDLWKCPDCGHEIVVGCAGIPVAEHFQETFKERVAQFRATLTVNDC